MKRMLVLVVASCIAVSGSLFAALGNTEDEVAELFGKPVDQGFPDKRGVITDMYQKGNYVIIVQFLNHLSLAESYTRTDKHELSENEISAFLDGSSNDRGWNKTPDKQAWERTDHKARAWVETLSGRPTLLIQAH
jgi:hypothetical protein